MNDIKISVLMPVFNCSKYIVYAIDSILYQTYKNIELLILDSSDDETSDILKKYKDKRIRYYHKKYLSISNFLNIGLDVAQGEYIARMDADDISNVKRLETQLKYLVKHNDVDLVGSNFYYINEYNKIIMRKKMPENHEDIEFMMPIEASILHPTMMCKKDVFKKIGYYNPNYISEDCELFLRMLENEIIMYNIQLELYYYRFAEKSKDLIRKQKENRILLGKEYLNIYYKRDSYNKLAERNFRFGLLEYYNGNISESRKFFYKSTRRNKKYFFIVLRYLIVSLLGNKCLTYLRNSYFFAKLNMFIYKTTGFDTHNIKNFNN